VDDSKAKIFAGMQVWKNISGLFQRNESSSAAQIDTTYYEVETRIGKYSGTIAYQDSVTLKLQSSNTKKPVKIMKENIVRIRIAMTEDLKREDQN
jgi:hypothetical protein